MELNSCLYETRIMHHRLSPKEHKFSYSFFSFYLDLNEIDALPRRTSLFGRNRFNLYSFYDKDHMGAQASVQDNVRDYLKENGVALNNGRIMLLTYVRTLGHIFNPVSFYFCFDGQGKPVCVIPEIGNTFGEIKPFMISADHFQDGKFRDRQDKFYYISPFTKLDDQLDFRLTVPDDALNIGVDTSKNGKKVILTTMTGRCKELTTANLLWLTCKVPFVTLKAIWLIHWHAFLLWLKKVPFEEKTSNLHLQKEVQRAWIAH